MSQAQPRSKKLHDINVRHANLLSFFTAAIGLAFVDFMAYLSGGFEMAGIFAASVIVFLGVRAAVIASRKRAHQAEDQ